MSLMQYWQHERHSLASALTPQTSAAGAVSLVRHALLQTEQNALAAMDDDVLRQQASVLISSLKSSLQLLQAHSAGHVWVAKKQEYSPSLPTLWIAAAAPLALLLLWCWWKSFLLPAVLTCTCAVLGMFALFQERKAAGCAASNDELKITVGVQPERLLQILDSQLTAIDRYLEDFAYLNAQARGAADHADPILLSRAADLMEALYEYDETERECAEDSACKLLEQLGMMTVSYAKETSRLFTTLPSKSTTRTLSPAIVSAQDQRLLRRGTAAVCTADKA